MPSDDSSTRTTLITASLRARQSPRFTALYDALVGHLRAVGAGRGSVAVGDPFPDFLLPAGGRLLRRADVGAGRPLILSFVRGLWCPYCRTALGALRAIAPAVAAAGGAIAVATPEANGLAGRLERDFDAAFTVLCDLDLGLSLACGLAFPVPEELRLAYREIGVDLAVRQDNGGWLLPIPATFVLDRDGIVRFAHVDADFRDRPDPALFLDALRRCA